MDSSESPFDNFGDREEKGKERETNFIPPPKMSEEEKETLKRLASEGLGVNEIARKMHRSPATVSRAIKRLRKTGSLALAKAGKLLEGKLNALETLQKTHKKAWDLLEKLAIKTGENATKNAKNVYLACESLRRDLELQLKIYETLYNVEEVTRFQSDILDVLGEVAPDVREQFYRRLQERRPV
jgi:IS30 family transposase